MIQLTRLRHSDHFYLNPDLIERVDTHVDTVVRLVSGTEYVVNETGDEIVRRTAEFRARVIALAGLLQSTMLQAASDVATLATPPLVASDAGETAGLIGIAARGDAKPLSDIDDATIAGTIGSTSVAVNGALS